MTLASMAVLGGLRGALDGGLGVGLFAVVSLAVTFLAEDTGPVGALVRHGEAATLTVGARPPVPPPARELTLRDAFQTTDEP